MVFPIAIFWSIVFVGTSLLLFIVAWLVSRLAFGGTKSRWVQVFAALFVLWLPFWDVLPGYLVFQHAVDNVSGVRIHKTVYADGYLQTDFVDSPRPWTILLDSPYQYVEAIRTRAGNLFPQVETSAGYYRYVLAALVSPVCSASNVLRPEDVGTEAGVLLGERCVVVEQRGEPFSRYEYGSTGWVPYKEWPAFSNVQIFRTVIVDRSTKEVLAESCQVRWQSWMGLFGARHFRNDNDQPISLDVKTVLIPTSAREGA